MLGCEEIFADSRIDGWFMQSGAVSDGSIQDSMQTDGRDPLAPLKTGNVYPYPARPSHFRIATKLEAGGSGCGRNAKKPENATLNLTAVIASFHPLEGGFLCEKPS